MRTLIVYYSKTGNTQKYAEDIGQSLKADVIPIKKFKKKMIDEYDNIIFGGRVMASRIQKLDDFLANYDLMKEKNVIIFAVGMSLVSKQSRADLISGNLLDMYHVRFYQLRGSFDYSKLPFIERMLMGHSIRMIENDPDATPEQKTMLTIKDHPIEYYDYDGVNRIISVVRKLDTVVPETAA